MKCAIFGAAGFIGRHLTDDLLEQGHGCHAYDRVTPDDASGACWATCDVSRDPIAMPDGVDAVYYLAQSPRYREFPVGGDELFAVNAIGALRVAEAAIDAGARYLCFASSGSVYAPSFRPRAEHDPVRRDDAYALSKLVAEDLLGLLSDRIAITAVRLFGVFGPGQQGMLVPGIIGRIRDDRAVTLQPHPDDPDDHGGLRLSLTPVGDAAWILRRLAEHRLVDGRPTPGVLNVAGPTPVSLRELAEGLGRVIGRAPRFETAETPRSSDFIADVGRLTELLGPSFTELDVAYRQAVPSPAASHGA